MGFLTYSVEEFGRALIDTGDLDPVYIMLSRSFLPPQTLQRWLLAYFCFYHAGVCSKTADEPNDKCFWDSMIFYATVINSPRGTERRHFRGRKAVEAVQWLEKRFKSAESFFDFLQDGPMDLASVRKRAETIPQFGPWISFKVADMMDAVLGVPVQISPENLSMFSEPTEGAYLVWKAWGNGDDAPVEEVVSTLLTKFSHMKAPPRYDKPVGVFEVETILCKVKAYWQGRYPVGKDTREVGHALQGWGLLSEKLGRNLPDLRHLQQHSG